MVLSKREKYIGIGAIAAVVLLGLNSLVYEPYNDKITELRQDKKTADDQFTDNQKLLITQKEMQPEWNAMLSSGLQADDSSARLRTQQMIQAWARVANVSLNEIQPQNQASAQKSAFQTINFSLDFNVSGNDAMRQVARLVSAIESAHIPLRLESIHMQSAKEGTDQVNVKMVVSSLYMPPTGQAGSQTFEQFYDIEGTP